MANNDYEENMQANNDFQEETNPDVSNSVPTVSGESVDEQSEPLVCAYCGAVLASDAMFCAKCGQKVLSSVDPTDDKINQFNANVAKSAKKKKLIPIIAAVVVIAVVLIVVLVTGGIGPKNFKDMYPELENEVWCTIASDGSYLKIDSNPFDFDSDDYPSLAHMYASDADNMVEKINKDLGFSSALMEKMNTTTWSQGRQTDSNSKYRVTWTYHPDKGLEVMYEMNQK